MLTRYAERLGFATEAMDVGEGKFTFAIRGDGAYSVFKFEGGTHRVQRVPETESQGRVHTSTATVAVLPEAEEVDIQIDPNDLQIDVYRSTGPGGQSVNTTDSAVRITHKPSGVVVAMQDEKPSCRTGTRRCGSCVRAARGAWPNRRRAATADQVGTGDREEKIRTYNFREPRDRPPHQAHRPQPRSGVGRVSSTSCTDGFAGRRAAFALAGPGGGSALSWRLGSWDW